ncbi:unnamed protein product, partial [marine sediment metagenome]
MCGISAVWSWSERETPVKRLLDMSRSQRHRGPDGHGYAAWAKKNPGKSPVIWRGPNGALPELKTDSFRLGFAHNWLAVQDESPASQQPLASADGRYFIVYNGEVYNFTELRDELAGHGFRFNGSSDTEVLLALWQRMGPETLDKLRGMFAFLVYDQEEDVLWAARDRFGIKPLYYSVLPGES